MTEEFATHKGLWQGDALSCLLFNLALEKVIRESEIDTRGTIFNKSIQLLAYADDIDIIGRSERVVREAFSKLEIAAKKMGLTVNEGKTKYLQTGRTQGKEKHITIHEYKFENVTQFKYLGTIITNDNSVTVDINSRIKMANKCYYGLKKQLQSRFLSIKTKCRLYKTLIRPVLLYGSESWTLSKENIERLMVFEKKVLRKVYGPVNEEGTWRIRYNTELYNLYNDANIIKVIKANRLRWLGHLYRMDDDSPCKKVTLTDPFYTVRKVGRPATRWLDDVEKDLKSIGVSRWKNEARDRTRWRRIIEAVLA